MINIERILGGVLRTAVTSGLRTGVGRRSSGSLLGGAQGAIGMGVLGVAMAAFDHFMQNRGPGSSGLESSPRQSFAGARGETPPPPPPSSNVPPPPPTAPGLARGAASSPPPLPAARGASPQALVLLRAMIAAANADAQIDSSERSRILQRVESAGLSAEERDFVSQELSRPVDLESLVREATALRLGEEAYTASLLTIDIDSPVEASYLTQLASRLGLDRSTVERCHTLAGVPLIV